MSVSKVGANNVHVAHIRSSQKHPADWSGSFVFCAGRRAYCSLLSVAGTIDYSFENRPPLPKYAASQGAADT